MCTECGDMTERRITPAYPGGDQVELEAWFLCGDCYMAESES